MSETPDGGGRRRKHRHDLGHEDHGPVVTVGTTRAIQMLLGLWIALTLGLVVYALVDASRPKPEFRQGAMSDTADKVAPR